MAAVPTKITADYVLDIATAPSANSRVWKQGKITWGEFCAWAEKPADTKECGGYVLGRFKGKRRSRESLIDRCAVALDADRAKTNLPDLLKIVHSWAVLIHTTWSHTIVTPRFRLIFPTDRHVEPDEYPILVKFLEYWFGADQFDKGSEQPERFMYRPATQDRDSYEFRVIDGDLLPVDKLLAEARRLGLDAEERSEAVAPAPATPVTDRHVEKAHSVLHKYIREVEAAPEGRNNTVFEALCHLYKFANADVVAEADVAGFREEFWEASQRAPGNHPFPRTEFDAVDASAKGRIGEAAELPRLDGPETDFDPMPAESGQEDLGRREREIRRELERLEVRDEARRRFEAARRSERESWDAGTLAEMAERPPSPPARVEDLIPWAASTAIIAQAKAGKTTLGLNLARCLITGEDFLDAFPVRQVDGRVAILNFEVSGEQFTRWALDVQVPKDRLYLVNLRGRRNPFHDAEHLADLAKVLRDQEVETVIVDPFGRAYTGETQNDAGQVQAWLMALERFVRADVGALDVVLSVHAGWNGERARGSSALEDWADSRIYLTRGDAEHGDAHARFLRADGRDVEVAEDKLIHDAATRRLRLSGEGDRKRAREGKKLDDLVAAAVEAVQAEPGLKTGHIESRMRDGGAAFQRGDASKALREALDRGLLRVENGPRNARIYYPMEDESPRTVTPESPRNPDEG